MSGDDERAMWREKAAAHRIAGKCPDCGANRGERSRCPTHLAAHAARARARRARA